jgi:hypothetical protein
MPIADPTVTVGLIEVLSAAVVGFGSMSGLMIRLQQKVTLLHRQNEKEHEAISKKLDDLNGTGRANTTDIARIRGVCEERHK